MKAFMRRIISMILVVALFANMGLTGFATGAGGEQRSAGDVFSFTQKTTWAEAGKQIAGMLSYIVEDAADIDLAVHSERIKDLSLEDDSVYLAILAEGGYLPEEPAQIDPDKAITSEEYVRLMEKAFPIVVDSQAAIDSLRGETELDNIAILGDDLSVTTMLPERLAVAKAQQLSLTAVKASALSLNAGSSVTLSESEITRVHIRDTAVKEEQPSEKAEPDKETKTEEETEADEETDLIYLHMDSGTQLPEVIVKSAEEVVIEGSGALGVVRVQEAVGSLTVRATGSVINETEEPMEVTGPEGETVELAPGEQVDFVLSKWLVSFVTEGTPVETQAIAPGGMVDFSKATTTLEGKIFTAWYEDDDYTTPVSRLSSVDKQMTLYARFVDESEAAVVTFETFGGRELEPMVFAKGEYLLTKPVESLYTSKDGYSFGGWCVDEACTTAFGYTEPIQESMTLYAMYSSYEQEVREDPGTVAEIELPDGAATIGLVLPQGMTAAEAEKNVTVEAGTGLATPEIAVRETESGAEVYCEEGFTPGTTFTLYVQNGVQFDGYPEYIDTLTVSVFREQVEVVEFAEGLTYVLWDNVTDYTPVSKTAVEYTTDYSADGTVHNMLEDHAAEGEVIPGKLVMTGKVNFQPEQIVVFYDGEINRDEATIDAWEGGDLAGYVLFAKIEEVKANADGTSEVIFSYADPETYITELDVHTTEEVDIEEQLSEEQIAQVEKAIASQLADNDELRAQMLVAVMTSEDTQRMLDDQYGSGTYSLAALVPYVSDPKLDITLSVEGSTVTAGVGVGITVSLRGPQGVLATLSPYLFFEEKLTLDMNVDGGFLWVDMSVLFNTKTTVSLQLKATTGDDLNALDEAKTTLEEIVQADGTAVEGYDYQEAADKLMNTMQELIEAELEYQDLFAVPLLKLKYTFYGLITVGVDVELVGQAAVVASFGVTVTAEYGQKIGFNYDFKKFKGGSYKEKLGSEVTTEVYLIGKIGVRVGIAVTLYLKILQNVTVSITGTIYAYVELAGMFLYTYALSAGGGNMAGAIHLEVGIDIEIELGLEVEILAISKEKNWTLWSHRWPLYSLSRGMTMGVVQSGDLNEMWEDANQNADGRTSYALPYIPMKTYDMLDASCTENQLLFENLQEGNVTAKLTLENVVINGEAVSPDDPRIDVIYVGDGQKGKPGVVYADEMVAAANQVTNYDCDVVLTYENKNKSELIKKHRQVFPFSREFKLATTTVNVNIALYDWCAHSWGIEAADWDNATVFKTTFKNTHVLGCPVEPTATGEIDLDAVIATVKAKYPEIDGKALSWFNPTLNSVNRTVQYSIPRISNMCYITPGSNTVRYDVFEATREYNLTFNLFASRYPGYTGEITYIIEAPKASADTVFTVKGSDEGETMTFAPVEEEKNRWSLTTPRASFDGSRRPIMMRANGGKAVASGLTVTGREAESVVILTLEDLTSALTVKSAEGIESWEIVSHEASEMSAMTPGEEVTLSAKLKEGYEGLRLTSEPAGLEYTTEGPSEETPEDNTVTATFTMPSNDVAVTLEGVRYYQADFLYNYGDLGTYQSVKVEKDESIQKPADPFINGLTFAGWYDNADCQGEPFDFTRKIDSDITLYADWRVNVTVDFGGAEGQARYVVDRRYEEIDGEEVEIVDSELIFPGNEDNFTQFTYTREIGETALEIVLPNYDGYDFMGWYLTSDFSGSPVDPTEYVLIGGVTFYARWEEIAVLTYELNYGQQEEPYAMTLEHVGLPLENIPKDPKREHYEFLGWFRTESGGEANRVALDSYIVEGTMTLYACWKPVEYTITYKLSGGENHPANPTSYNIESPDIVLREPTRTGYYFFGWESAEIEDIKGDGIIHIPAGSTGNITVTARWEPIVYTITYDLVRGETAETNPVEYTIEDNEIVLSNPSADGYEFTGWTGTGLAEKTKTVVIPAGSTGDRKYKANWRTNDPIGRIVELALEAIPDSYTMNLRDFTGIQDIEDIIMDLLSADENCADYIEQLSVSVESLYDPSQDDTSYLYTLKVTVTFTDDSDATTSESKEMELRVMKNPVEISAGVSYPTGSNYIPYGTKLSNVELTDCVATSNGETVTGTFTWDDPNAVPAGAKNGQKVYKVVFTPDDTANYSTAEILIEVNTQIGVELMLDVVPETIEYMGRKLNVESSDECKLYVVDADTGAKIDSVTPSVTGAVLEQSQITPGTADVWLSAVSGCELTGDFDPNMYAVVSATGKENGDTVTITRATTTLSGTMEYVANLGSSLSSIAINLTANTAYQNGVNGTFAWETPSTRLNTAGSFSYKVVFTPSVLSNYTTATITVTVRVNKQTVAIPTIASATYNGLNQKASISNTTYYTVESNNGGTNAGDYTVTLKLRDPANYQWSDGDESATKNLTFTIAPASLTVSAGYTVEPIGYGQRLVRGQELQTDTRYKSASDIISNANVTTSNGKQITGWWEWVDDVYAPVEGRVLPASAEGDNQDFGDGYSVLARFHMTSDNQNNYEVLEQRFPVQVTRVTPDTENSTAYVMGYSAYQPATGKKVNVVGNLLPRVISKPVNPNDTSMKVSGTLSWPATNRVIQETGYYNAAFTASTEIIDGKEGKNYNDDAVVKVYIEIKNDVDYRLSIADGVADIREGNSTSGTLTSSIISWKQAPGSISFTVNLNRSGEPYCIRKILVKRTDNQANLLETKYTVYSESNGAPTALTPYSYNSDGSAKVDLNAAIILTPTSYSPGQYGQYTLTLPGGADSVWNCIDLEIIMEMGALTQNEKFDQGLITYSLRNGTPDAGPDGEPADESGEGTMSIPEPDTIGNVVKIEPKQDAEKVDGVWKVQLAEDQEKVKFKWNTSKPASTYLVYTQKDDGKDELELIDMTADRNIELDVSDYESGRYKLYVGAVLEDGDLTWGEAKFELIPFGVSSEKPTEEPAEESAEEPAEEPPEEPTKEPAEEPAKEPVEEPTEESPEETTEEPAAEPIPVPTSEPATVPPKPDQEPQTAEEAA